MTSSRRARFRALLGGVVTLLLLLAVVGPLRRSLAPVAVDAGAGEVAEVVAAAELSDVGAVRPAGFEGPPRLADDDPDGTRTSRTWFAAGQWWAVLDAGGRAGGAAHIWRLTGERGPWEDTGVLVDDRPFAQPWVAWTGSELVVASSGNREYRSHGLQVNRFTWDPERRNWVRTADFPVRVTDAGAPGTQLVVDREGRAWLARQEGAGVVVASSDPDLSVFDAFAPLPDGQAAADVGSFALTLGDAGPQVVWRSATTDQLAVTTHRDGAWSTERVVAHGVGGSGVVQAAPAGPGRPGTLLVVVASSLPQRGANDQDPSVLLLAVRGTDVEVSVVSVAADRLRTPRLSVDRSGGTVHVVAVAEPPDPLPGSLPGPATVTTKSARIADLSFGTGPGAPVLEGASLQAPSVPTLVSAASGRLVLASGPDERQWKTVQEGGPSAGTAPTGPADGTLVHDTFDRAPIGVAIPTSWYGDRDGPAAAEVAGDPAGGRQLLLTNRDGGDATATCRAVPVTGVPVTVTALIRVEGVGTADTRLLTVKGAEGTLASLRLTRKGFVGYSSSAGRIDHAPLAPGDLRVSIRVDPARGVTDLLVARPDGSAVLDLRDLPALSPAGDGPDEVCASPPPGVPDGTLAIRDLTVTPT